MRITTRGIYALRAMIDLASEKGAQPVALAKISTRQGISLYYLEQLFMKLRRAGLVKSVKGPGGGYLLAKWPQQITIKDILKAVDEPLSLIHCAEQDFDAATCRKTEQCGTRTLLLGLKNAITRLLASITLDSFVGDTSKLIQAMGKMERSILNA